MNTIPHPKIPEPKRLTLPASPLPELYENESWITVTFGVDIRGEVASSARCDLQSRALALAIPRALQQFVKALAGATWGSGPEETDDVTCKIGAWLCYGDGSSLTVTADAVALTEPKDLVVTGLTPICIELSDKVRANFVRALERLGINLE
jgi:hypothetical protein